MSRIKISHPTKKINARIRIPGSKSESNRVLILNALSGNQLQLENLSTAHDTQQLIKILSSNDETADVLDSGTGMRFLTACYAALNKHKIITGDDRMKKRPLAPLVNALNEIGFNIGYLGEEGFPPVEINPVKMERLDDETFIEGNVSSQFITALLLIAPFLPKGLKINFTTELTSRPYIEMTLKILNHFSFTYELNKDFILIPHSEFRIPSSAFRTPNYHVAGDWSSASYWYLIAFLADKAEIFLEGLKDDWSQGDRVIADWMKRFGVLTEFKPEGALLKKTVIDYPRMMKLSFRDNPDLAQTFAAMFAAKNIYATFSGIESLKIKETDRVAALRQELRKMNVNFDYSTMYEFYQLKGAFRLPSQPVNTYNDHRMAMSFAPLALLGEIQIEDPEVVEKSYPEFWEDLKKAGYVVNHV